MFLVGFIGFIFMAGGVGSIESGIHSESEGIFEALIGISLCIIAVIYHVRKDKGYEGDE